MLLLIGSLMLVDELGYTLPYRWVALILLIPAAAAIADGFKLAKLRGLSDVHVLARIIAGALFAAMGIMLYLRIDIGVILPLLIMALGGAALLRALLGRR